MFCEKCGKRISDDAVACPNCGTSIGAEEIENITEENIAEENITEDNNEQEALTEEKKEQDSLAGENVPTENKEHCEIPVKKKKIKKGLLITGIVAAVICIVVVILTFPYIKNAFARLFMSSEDYFAYVVKNNSQESAKSIANTLDGLKKTTVNGTSSAGSAEIEVEESFHTVLADVTSDVKIGGTVGSILGKFTDVSVGGLTGWIGEVSVDYEIKSDGKNSQSVFDFDINDAEFGTVDITTDKAGGNSYIAFPDYCDGYFIKKNENRSSLVANAENVLVSLPEKELTEKLIMKYIECIAENVGDVEEYKTTVDAGKFSKKYHALTAEIDKDEMENITEILLDAIENDEDIAEIIGKVSKTSGDSDADIRKSLKDAFKTFNKFYSEELKGNMTLTLYVDSKGDIIGTKLSAGSYEYSNCTISKWFEIGNTIGVKAGVLSFKLEGNGKLEENDVTLDYVLSIAESHAADIHICELDYKKMQEGLYDAKANVVFDKNIAKLGTLLQGSGNSSVVSKLLTVAPDLMLNIELSQKTKDETAVSLKINHKNKLAASISISNKNGERKTVKIPDEYVDIAAVGLLKVLGTADLEKFVDFLGKAEFPNAAIIKLGYKLIF